LRLSLLGYHIVLKCKTIYKQRQSQGPRIPNPTSPCRYGWGEPSLSLAYFPDAPIIARQQQR
jgi:hypothetical protein